MIDPYEWDVLMSIQWWQGFKPTISQMWVFCLNHKTIAPHLVVSVFLAFGIVTLSRSWNSNQKEWSKYLLRLRSALQLVLLNVNYGFFKHCTLLLQVLVILINCSLKVLKFGRSFSTSIQHNLIFFVFWKIQI